MSTGTRRLAVKNRSGGRVTVTLADRVEVAGRLAARSSWPGGPTVSGYLWGRTTWDVAARLSANAAAAGLALAVTGRAGAAFLGTLGTSSPAQVRCRVAADSRPLTDVASMLGLDPAPDEAASDALSPDPWHLGIHRRSSRSFVSRTATVAHPVRVWCDLHSETRGAEFAAQLWGTITDAE